MMAGRPGKSMHIFILAGIVAPQGSVTDVDLKAREKHGYIYISKHCSTTKVRTDDGLNAREKHGYIYLSWHCSTTRVRD